MPLYGTAHQGGTVRFGTDPKSSVLDPWCKAHELDNLYVVDTSFFVTSAAVNPTLTSVANAMRVGDHLIERLGARAPHPQAKDAGRWRPDAGWWRGRWAPPACWRTPALRLAPSSVALPRASHLPRFAALHG